MALLFCDSFDHYQDGNLAQKWDAILGTSTGLLTTGGRRGGGAYRPNPGTTSTQNGNIRKNITPSNTVVLGFAFRIDVHTIYNNHKIVSFYSNNDMMASLNFKNTGPGEYCVFDSNGVVVGEAVAGLPLGAWVYVETKVVVGDLGSIVVRVNGLTTIEAVGVDTRNGSSNFINNVRINAEHGASIATLDRRFDDFYVLNNTGDRNNDFLGDVSVVTIRPDLPGTHQDFLPSSGSDHVAMVNQTLLTTTSYLQSQGSGSRETFQMTDIDGPLSVVALQVVNAVRKTDAGPAFANNLLRSGPVESVAPPFALSVSTQFLTSIAEVNPNGEIPWTLGALNAVEAGIRITEVV
jgi:hypothetical protein